jgi:3-methylcrotonyl-CoA carboxylase alpha subunit
VRIDSGVVEGDTVSIFYDPMIAKLIVWDRDRTSALARMRGALAGCAIVGPKSNIAFLERLVRHPAIVDGSIDTGYLDRRLDEFLPAHDSDPALLLAGATAHLLLHEAAERSRAVASPDPTSPWALADGWRLGHAGQRRLAFLHRGERLQLLAHGNAGNYVIERDGHTHDITGARMLDGVLSARFDGQARRFDIHDNGSHSTDNRLDIHDGAQRLTLEPVAVYRREHATQGNQGNRVQAPMPGRVVLVKAQAGDTVVAGQELLVMEAMKMELALKAPRAGVVAEVRAAAGDFVEADAVLVTLEA